MMEITKDSLLTIEARAVLAGLMETKIKEAPNKALTKFDKDDALKFMSEFVELLELIEV